MLAAADHDIGNACGIALQSPWHRAAAAFRTASVAAAEQATGQRAGHPGQDGAVVRGWSGMRHHDAVHQLVSPRIAERVLVRLEEVLCRPDVLYPLGRGHEASSVRSRLSRRNPARHGWRAYRATNSSSQWIV